MWYEENPELLSDEISLIKNEFPNAEQYILPNKKITYRIDMPIVVKGRVKIWTLLAVYNDDYPQIKKGDYFDYYPIKIYPVKPNFSEIQLMINNSKGMFKKCYNLKKVTISDMVMTIDEDVFRDCTLLSVLNIPINLQIIETHAFDNCRSLLQITLSDRVKKIGYAAFYNCNNLEITIDSHTEVCVSFGGCKKLMRKFKFLTIPTNPLFSNEKPFSNL